MPPFEIYQSILLDKASHSNGLNGFLLLIPIGTDPQRTDKVYNQPEALLTEPKGKGYRFVRLNELLK